MMIIQIKKKKKKNITETTINKSMLIKDNNYFIIVSIPRYIERGKNKYGEYLFEYTKGYKFYTSCKGKNCYEQDLEISLDSRENPSVIYVHFGDNVYKINIP